MKYCWKTKYTRSQYYSLHNNIVLVFRPLFFYTSSSSSYSSSFFQPPFSFSSTFTSTHPRPHTSFLPILPRLPPSPPSPLLFHLLSFNSIPSLIFLRLILLLSILHRLCHLFSFLFSSSSSFVVSLTLVLLLLLLLFSLLFYLLTPSFELLNSLYWFCWQLLFSQSPGLLHCGCDKHILCHLSTNQRIVSVMWAVPNHCSGRTIACLLQRLHSTFSLRHHTTACQRDRTIEPMWTGSLLWVKL